MSNRGTPRIIGSRDAKQKFTEFSKEFHKSTAEAQKAELQAMKAPQQQSNNKSSDGNSNVFKSKPNSMGVADDNSLII
jgi:hypothetical protein